MKYTTEEHCAHLLDIYVLILVLHQFVISHSNMTSFKRFESKPVVKKNINL